MYGEKIIEISKLILCNIINLGDILHRFLHNQRLNAVKEVHRSRPLHFPLFVHFI